MAVKKSKKKTRRIDPLYEPTVQLSGPALAKAARRLAGIEIDPQVHALDTQAQTAQTQGTALAGRAAGYFAGLGKRTDAAKVTAQAISDQLNQRLGAISAGAQTHVDQATADAQRAQSADVALRGEGLSGGGEERLAAELAAQRANGATTGQAFQSAGAIKGAAGESLQNEIGASRDLQGGETQRQLTNRLAATLAGIGSKKADIEGQRGGLELQNLLKLRQSGFDNLATLRGLNIKGEQIAQDAAQSERNAQLAVARINETSAHNKTTEKISGGNLALSQAKFASATEKDAYQRLHNLGPYKPPASPKGAKEPQASLNVKRQIGNAMSSYQRYLAAGHSLPWIAQHARKQNVPPDVLNAAADLANFGYILPAHQRILERAGVRIPADWKKRGGQAAGGRN